MKYEQSLLGYKESCHKYLIVGGPMSQTTWPSPKTSFKKQRKSSV